MKMRWTVCIAALGLAAAGPARAQLQPGAGQEPPACVKKFVTLRTAAEARAKAIQSASQRKQKPTAQQACSLFNAFSSAEEKLVKYAVENQTWCGIPPQIVESMKKAHARTAETRTRICRAAAAERVRPRGPTLSDTLDGAVPNAGNIRTGRGTYDTLTGSPLGTR